MGEEESVRLLDSKGKKKDVSYSLGRVETVLAILNFFRNVTTAEDVGRFCASLPRFAELLLRPCILEANFAAKRAKAGGGGVDLDLKVSDLLTIRKDVAFIFSSVGLDVELTTTNGWVADAVVELLSWFLDLTNELDEGWMGRGKEKGGAGAGANGPPIHRLSYATEIALLALAKISTKDPNREVIAAALDSAKVEDVIDRLKFYIPIQEDSLTVVPAFESGIVTLEFLTISMFNFIFLSKPSLKRKLTLKTDLVKSILSLVQRIMPKFPTHPGESMPPQMACRVPVCQRCLDILRCLNESISDSSDVQTKEDGAVWFGGGFVDEEAEDETIFKAEKKTPALLADHVNAISWINSSKHPPKNIVSDLQSLCYSLN
ncbi:hypothetical protein BT69DRAFT_13247 [Atractiella rhizophila]|nr:hypothetical protein BT69DRAFT_13247 [Atractiella rhizophila]